jgi:hypothetical protein
MISRVFEDEKGKIWIVTKLGSSLEVQGRRRKRRKSARYCQKLRPQIGSNYTPNPVSRWNINEHRRIWNAIWEKGRSTPNQISSIRE